MAQPNDVQANPGSINDPLVYKLLAPIGPNTEIRTTDVGQYFNFIFMMAISLMGVLAVIMIIINAIKYMGGDSVFSKEEGKSGMTAALIGLFIALGAYALLNTINPDLLGRNGLTIDQANIVVEDPIDTDVGKPLPTGGVNQCGGGIEFVTGTTFAICKDIKKNLTDMLAAAKNDGIILSGGAFRTHQEQVDLRNKYCGGDLTNPKATCSRPVAVPGSSYHESGKALDLKCDGVGIKSKNNKCYIWLALNAGKYGFENLKSSIGNEPWHWSVGGN